MLADYYGILGVASDADADTIHRRYRRLAASCHPDLHLSDPARRDTAEERMRAINAAYEVLGDSARRADYDSERARRQRAAAPATPRCIRKRVASRRAEALECWVMNLVVLAVAAGALGPRLAGARSAAARPEGPAAVLARFVAAYQADDIPRAAQMLDPKSCQVIIEGRGAPSRESLFRGAAAQRRLLAAGFEARRGVGRKPREGDATLLACLGGLAGGVEVGRAWQPPWPIPSRIASVDVRFRMSDGRAHTPAEAVFTLRRQAREWRICGVVLRVGAP